MRRKIRKKRRLREKVNKDKDMNLVGNRYHVSVYIKKDLYEKLKKFANNKGLTMSATVNMIITEYFSKNLSEDHKDKLQLGSDR